MVYLSLPQAPFHTEQQYDLYISSNIFRVTKCRKTRWKEHVTSVGKRRKIHNVFVVVEIEHVDNLGLDGIGKLKCVVEK